MYLTKDKMYIYGIIKRSIEKDYLFLPMTESQHFLIIFSSITPDFCLNTENF